MKTQVRMIMQYRTHRELSGRKSRNKNAELTGDIENEIKVNGKEKK